MLGDTITITFDGESKVLVKINQDQYSSEYLLRETDGSFGLKVRHSTTKRGLLVYDRHNVEISHNVYAVADVPEYDQRAYFVFENLKSDVDAVLPMVSLATWALASSNAALTKLAGWES